MHAVRLLFKLSSDISNLYSERAEIRVNPQCININGDLNLTDIDNHIRDTRYHFIVSFKALNELIQRDTFPDENVYRKIAAHFLPFLEPNGTLVISDLTHKAPDGIYYPKRINAGFISLVRATFEFKSIFPHPCYFHEKQCSGYYMQDRITVSHSGVDSPDPTKVVYRALCRADFADAIMQGIKPCPCRFTEGFSADKALPYLNSNL